VNLIETGEEAVPPEHTVEIIRIEVAVPVGPASSVDLSEHTRLNDVASAVRCSVHTSSLRGSSFQFFFPHGGVMT
jgi:hypothetical protein